MASLTLAAPVAEGGWYLAPAARWSVFSVRPEAEEPTPNFYGFGGTLSAGYSARQILDIGAFGQYIPGARGQAKFATDDASLVSYGGELALRLADSVYLGTRGGYGKYRIHRSKDETELRGRWDGLCGGVSIGAVARVAKTGFVQTTFDVMHFVLEEADGGVTGKRRFDAFGLGVAYVYNSHNAYLIENTIFKDFLDSMIFF